MLPAALNPASVVASAANASRGEKSRLGLRSRKTGVHRGFAACNSRAALGLREASSKSRVGSRCTGKERDTESGLDNFGKRYYGSSLGRFMSVDPHDFVVSDARNPKKFRSDLLDPQGWNRYAYVTNNPLKFADWEGLEKYLVVYVQQPVAGTATTWTREGFGVNTGHAFIGLKDTTAHTEVKAGFYPKEMGTVTPLSPSTTGVVKDDSNHSWNVKQEYKITDDQYNAVQTSISNDKADTNLQYNLNTNNCTDWVMDTAGVAGVTLPDATGTWPQGGGESPGPLGQELASQPGATVQQQNGDGSSGSSSGSSAKTDEQKKPEDQ